MLLHLLQEIQNIKIIGRCYPQYCILFNGVIVSLRTTSYLNTYSYHQDLYSQSLFALLLWSKSYMYLCFGLGTMINLIPFQHASYHWHQVTIVLPCILVDKAYFKVCFNELISIIKFCYTNDIRSLLCMLTAIITYVIQIQYLHQLDYYHRSGNICCNT